MPCGDVSTEPWGSVEALRIAHLVLAREGVLLTTPSGRASVPLATIDDVREVAYLALEIAQCDPVDATLRVCRWLHRHREGAP